MLQRRALEGYKLAFVRSRGVLMVGCVATERGEVAGTETSGKGRIISFTHNALKKLLAITSLVGPTYLYFLESEGTFANIVTGHKRVVNDDSWLHKKVVLNINLRIKRMAEYLLRCLCSDTGSVCHSIRQAFCSRSHTD